MKILNILNKTTILLSYLLTFLSVVTLIIGLSGFIEILRTIPSSLSIKNGIGIIFLCTYCIIGFINSIVFLLYIVTKSLLDKTKFNNINKTKGMLVCLVINFIPLLICIFSFFNLMFNWV